MLTYIENLRKRPEPERRRAVLRLSLLFMAAIVLVWAVVLWFRIENTDFSFDADAIKENAPNVGETFRDLMGNIGSMFGEGSTTPQE